MMKLIIASAKDPAAKNIAAQLLQLYDFEKSSTVPDLYIQKNVAMTLVNEEATKITALPFDADEVIIASRHASEVGRPSLTVHAPGEIERGELAMVSPSTIKSALQALVSARDDFGLPHEVSLEATHHGPVQLEVPVTFVEIGSTPDQWQNEKAGEAAALAIMAAASSQEKCVNAAAFGGPHYAPRHTEVSLRSRVGVGHILPKYVNFDEKLIEQTIICTEGGVKMLVLDWKGMSREQRALCQHVAAGLSIPAVRTDKIPSEANI